MGLGLGLGLAYLERDPGRPRRAARATGQPGERHIQRGALGASQAGGATTQQRARVAMVVRPGQQAARGKRLQPWLGSGLGVGMVRMWVRVSLTLTLTRARARTLTRLRETQGRPA